MCHAIQNPTSLLSEANNQTLTSVADFAEGLLFQSLLKAMQIDTLNNLVPQLNVGFSRTRSLPIVSS